MQFDLPFLALFAAWREIRISSATIRFRANTNAAKKTQRGLPVAEVLISIQTVQGFSILV
jgi:hypothetical protein